MYACVPVCQGERGGILARSVGHHHHLLSSVFSLRSLHHGPEEVSSIFPAWAGEVKTKGEVIRGQ